MQHPFSSSYYIWHPDGYSVNETMLFSRSFHVADPSDCRIFIHVNSHYALYINEQFVSLDPYPDYEYYRVYDELNLTPYVKPGINSLSITAYCQGEDSSTYRAYPAELSYAIYQGDTLLAVSDETTQVCRDTRYASDHVAKVSGQLSYSFDYDAVKTLDSPIPAKSSGPCCLMHPRPIQKLALDPPEPTHMISFGHFSDPAFIENYALRMQNASIISSAASLSLPSSAGISLNDNWCLIDLGKEQTGYFYLDIDLPQESEVLIGWGEHLEDLRVRTAVGGRNFAARFRGKAGRNTFFYPIKRLGLRYLQLHIYAPCCTLYYAGVRPARYPLSKVQLFTCADHLHSQIYRTSLRTLQHCMHDHYEDCPWREQALYTMDSRNQMLCGYYAFEEYEFAKASLKLMSLSLRPDHLLELTSPAKVPLTIPSFSAIFLVQLAEYLYYSHDTDFAYEMLPIAQDIADGFIQCIDECGLIRRICGPEYWHFYEWQTGLDGHADEDDSAFDAPLSAFVSLGWQHLAQIYQTLGKEQLALFYQEHAQKLNYAIHQNFYDPEQKCYATTLQNGQIHHYAELTQALTLLCDAVPEDQKASVLRCLAGQTDTSLYPITLSHSIFKYEALMLQPEQYSRIVFQMIAKSYGAMLYQGATTFWETSDGASAFDLAGSLCHGWSAIPVYFYLRYCVDLKKEGTLLSPSLAGIYEPRASVYPDGSRRILDDNWD